MPATAPEPAPQSAPESAIVLFSGGQDSTACLAWALERFAHVETIGFDYGQRHRVELACRAHDPRPPARRASRLGGRLGDDHSLDLGVLGAISETALTRDSAIEMPSQRPAQHLRARPQPAVPHLAAALAYRRGLAHLVGGMCETDYSGYPDCRDDTLKALQVALNLGMDAPLRPRHAADVARQGRHLEAGRGARRQALVDLDQRGDAHLLPRRTRRTA